MPRPGGHGQKCNWISAILASDRSWQMPWVVNGTINRAVVEQWLAALGQALPQNAADPKPYVLIWDNASFHLGGELLAIAKLYRIRIVQLPAYSPDFNPIEQCWATLKHYTAPLRLTDIQLEPGEEIIGKPAAGDTVRWVLGVNKSV